MPDVPDAVQYGKVTGRFVSFRADSSDAGDAPDEVPLTGKVTLTPTVPYMRWRNTTPPRLSAIEPIVCQIVDGNLKAPDGIGDVYVVATNQPDADPNIVQWKASFRFDGSTSQPSDTVFNVPANGSVDLAVVIPAEEQPGVVIVVSAEDRLAAEQAAQQAIAAAAMLGDTGWIELDIPEPWEAYSVEIVDTPAYRVKNGVVYFRGIVTRPAATSGNFYSFPIPEEAQPRHTLFAVTPVAGSAGVATINSGGIAIQRQDYGTGAPIFYLASLSYISGSAG